MSNAHTPFTKLWYNWNIPFGILKWAILKTGTGNQVYFGYLAEYYAWMIETHLFRHAGEHPQPD
jgi:hypothetical protein